MFGKDEYVYVPYDEGIENIDQIKHKCGKSNEETKEWQFVYHFE